MQEACVAKVMIPNPQQRAGWNEWLASRPDSVRNALDGKDPWTLYRMKSSGHRVTLYSASEDGTLTVTVSGEHNAVAFERNVFGIQPDDLEECDLPSEDEAVGVLLNEAEQLEYVNAVRAENGLPPLPSLSHGGGSCACCP